MEKTISPLWSAIIVATVGLLIALIWNETTIRIFGLAAFFTSWGISAKFLVFAVQGAAALGTIIGGFVAAWLAVKIVKRLPIDGGNHTVLLSTALWWLTFYAHEISAFTDYFPVTDAESKTLLILYAGRIAVDILAGLLFWYTLRSQFQKIHAA